MQGAFDGDGADRRLGERLQRADVGSLGRGDRQRARELAEIERVLGDVMLEALARERAGGELGVERQRVDRLTQRRRHLPSLVGKADGHGLVLRL